MGSVLGYMATATHGACLVLPSESFNARAVLESVDAYGCTALYGVPTMFAAELALLDSGEYVPKRPQPGGALFPLLRTGISAGSLVPPTLMSQIHERLGLTGLTICYGMTETSPVSFMTHGMDPLERRTNSVGRLLPHISAKVVKPGTLDAVLPMGQPGELVVSGYSLMTEYYGDPEKTAKELKETPSGRWMLTGDQAVMEPGGWLRITGRIKDLIIRGGENILPSEVEDCIWGHPSVRQVSVIGVPDEHYGETVGAFVILRECQGSPALMDEIRSWVRTKLSGHLVPKHIWFVDDLPKTPSGKVQKFVLKEMAERYLAEGVS